MQNDETIPTLECWPIGTSGSAWGFVCPHCRAIHTHGPRGLERTISAACHSEAGREAYRYGYRLKAATNVVALRAT